MVTFINSSPEKKFYRHFRLLQSKNNDVESLNEIANRRVKHLKDWGRPDLIVVDGGKGQVNAFKKVFDSLNIPVVGIAKRYEKLIIPLPDRRYVSIKLKGDVLNLIQRIRDEAHRFAQKYHHLLVNKYLIKTDRIS
jgi:excinuclease ABC subunit C